MAQRGRKCLIKLEVQMELYSLYISDIIVDGKLQNSNHDIYKTLAQQLLGMSPKGIYLSIKKNILTLCTQNNVEILSTQFDQSNDSSNLSLKNDSNWSESSEKVKKNDLVWNLDITGISLFETTVYLSNTLSGKRLRKKLKDGWSDKLVSIVWNNTKLDCIWSFKRGDIINNEVVCLADCIECNAILSTETITTKHKTNLKIHVKCIKNNFVHSGNNKRKVRWEAKSEILKKLKCSSSLMVRNEMAQDLMDEGDLEPGHLPKNTTLNQIKYKESVKSFDKDPIQSLIKMMSNEYKAIISDIGYAPFYIFYCLPLQIEWYKQQKKSSYVAISIDATGSVVKPPNNLYLSEKTNKPVHVFFYTVMAKQGDTGTSVPVAQMLSQKQSSNFISYWLNSWVKRVGTMPNEVIIDNSAALLKSIVNAFTDCGSVEKYICNCIISVKYKGNRFLPKVFIRLDRSHYVKQIHRIKIFKNQDIRKIKFIKNILGFLIICDNFSECQTTIRHLFTVILNMYADANSPAYISKNILMDICETHKCQIDDFINIDYNENDIQGTAIDDIENENNDDNWISELLGKVNILEHGHTENLYYFPNLIPILKNMFKQIPLWSNIMVHSFKSKYIAATSSDVECFFRKQKTEILSEKMIRIDKFIKTQIQFLTGELKLQSSSQKKILMKTNDTQSSKVDDGTKKQQEINYYKSSEESEEENWKGFNRKIKKVQQRRSKTSILNKNSMVYQKIPVISNGYISRTNKSSEQVLNTCGFDSVLSVLMALYVDIEFFKNIMDKENSTIFHLIKESFSNVSKSFYQMRNKILIDFNPNGPQIYENGLTVYDLETNISTVINYIIDKNILNFYSFTKIINCPCSFNLDISFVYLPININYLEMYGIQYLQQTIVSNDCYTCDCGKPAIVEIKYNELLIIDVQQNPIIEEAIDVNIIPKVIHVDNINYKLKAFIERTGNEKSGHYIANILRPDNSWQQYDDTKNFVGHVNNTSKPHILFYVVEI